MGAWEDLFERRYGFWRGLLDGVVARYLDCGIFERGFARIRCPGSASPADVEWSDGVLRVKTGLAGEATFVVASRSGD